MSKTPQDRKFITDRQKEIYFKYLEVGSYRGTGQKMDLDTTTVRQAVLTVENKIQEVEELKGKVKEEF